MDLLAIVQAAGEVPLAGTVLRHGSRSRLGSLVEGAFYALLFWEGFREPPKAPIRRRQTLFSVLLQTSRGRQLQVLADAAAQAALRDPRQYGPTQRLGSWMREEGIEAFEYLSARTREPLVQVGCSRRRHWSPRRLIRWRSPARSTAITRPS
jgi:hypothetical protein